MQNIAGLNRLYGVRSRAWETEAASSAVILSDFACLEAENSTEESEQASSNEKVVIESSEDNAVWEVEQAHDRQDGSAHQVQFQFEHGLEEVEMIVGKLDAATACCDKLKPESAMIGESARSTRVRKTSNPRMRNLASSTHDLG